MNINKVIEFINNSNGKIFTIKFIKRTDKSIREMTCRKGVTKYLVANPSKEGLNFKDYNLISVYDMVAKGYRSIPIEGIIAIKMAGEWINVERPSEAVA